MGVRRMVGGISRDLLRTAFRDWFGVQDNQADLLVLLFERNGQPMSSRGIGQALQSHRPLATAAVHERVRVLRSAMAVESVDCDEGGYFLSEVGLDECRHALRGMARTLLGEGVELPRIEGRYEYDLVSAEG